MISNAVTVNTTPTLLLAADNKNRYVYVHNSGGAKIYIGGSAVTTANGFHLANTESIELFVPLGETLHAVVSTGTNVCNVLLPDLD